MASVSFDKDVNGFVSQLPNITLLSDSSIGKHVRKSSPKTNILFNSRRDDKANM